LKYIKCLDRINRNTRFIIEHIIDIVPQQIVKPKKKE